MTADLAALPGIIGAVTGPLALLLCILIISHLVSRRRPDIGRTLTEWDEWK